MRQPRSYERERPSSSSTSSQNGIAPYAPDVPSSPSATYSTSQTSTSYDSEVGHWAEGVFNQDISTTPLPRTGDMYVLKNTRPALSVLRLWTQIALLRRTYPRRKLPIEKRIRTVTRNVSSDIITSSKVLSSAENSVEAATSLFGSIFEKTTIGLGFSVNGREDLVEAITPLCH